MSPLTPLSWQEHHLAGHMAVGPQPGWGDRIKFETEVHYLHLLIVEANEGQGG